MFMGMHKKALWKIWVSPFEMTHKIKIYKTDFKQKAGLEIAFSSSQSITESFDTEERERDV